MEGMMDRRWLLQLPLALNAAAKTHRVADAGELRAALRSVAPGDTILMRDGIWTDAELVFTGVGTARAPITLRAETPGRVILKGQSSLRLSGQYLHVASLRFEEGYSREAVIAFRTAPDRPARHCRVSDCALRDYNVPDRESDTKWVSLYGTDNRFDHNSIRGKTNAGTTLVVWLDGEPNRHRIDHNHFGPRPALGKNGGETIRVGTSEWSMSDSRTVVESNYFGGCDGEVEIISSKSCENIYRGNTFVECEGALTLRHGNRCVVQDNVFLGHGRKLTGGVRMMGEDHRVCRNRFEALGGEGTRSALSMMCGLAESPLNGYFQVKRALVEENTFVDCRATLTLGIVSQNPKGATLPPEDCRFVGNYLRSRLGPLVRLLTPPVRLRWEDNVAFGAELGIEAVEGLRMEDRPVPRLVSPPVTEEEVGPRWK